MSALPEQPTIADVLAELRLQGIEAHAEAVEVRSRLAELRLDVVTRFSTLYDELVAFRAEYNQHTHD